MGATRSPVRILTRRQVLKNGGVALLAGALGSCAGCRGQDSTPSTPGRPNVIVYLADTLRADHLGCYGHHVPTTPRMDTFAASAVLFEWCFAQGPWTKPSMGSLFTGVMPGVHQAVATNLNGELANEQPVQVLRSQFVTLAESLKSAGYHTGLFLANPQIQKEYGFAQGFDDYLCISDQDAKQQARDAIAWMATAREAPFFAFVHQLDPHGPYTPPPAKYRELFGVSVESDRSRLPAEDIGLLDDHVDFYRRMVESPAEAEAVPLRKLSPKGLAFLRRLYDGEIAYVDAQFGRLLSYLDRRGLAQNTVVVLTSDHGEAFNEHGTMGHGNSIYNEEIHVPLIIRVPGQERSLRVPYSVSLYDLYPTLTTLSGASTPPYVQSASLFDSSGACVVDQHRPVFSSLDYRRAETSTWDACVQKGPYKVTTRRKGQRMAGHLLTQDPAEAVDLIENEDSHGRELRILGEQLRAAIREDRTLAASFGEAEWSHIEERHREELNAIGYL